MTICLLKVWVCSVYVLAFAVYTGDATRKLVQLPRNPGNVGQAFTGPGGGLTTSLICEQCRQTGNTECIQRYCDGAFGGGAVTPEVIPSAGPWPRTSDVANWLCRVCWRARDPTCIRFFCSSPVGLLRTRPVGTEFGIASLNQQSSSRRVRANRYRY